MTLADLVAAELRRLDVPERREAGPPMARLREAGRELETPTPCRVAGQPATVLSTLDRTAIILYADGQRQAVGADRVEIDAADVRWRDAQFVPYGYETIDVHGTHARRARAFAIRGRLKQAATPS